MTSRSVAKNKKPSLNSMPPDEFADYLFKKLESEQPQVPSDFSDSVDRRFQTNAARRVGLIFLSKPWKEIADGVTEDRALAVAFAKVSMHLDESITLYKGLVELLGTAKLRMQLALCARKDMDEVLAEAKQSLTEAA